ncbi:thiolase family protein [Dehalococcoidia bacterium]|nr:thiolase family protein [Dehalococcoidia bacterium]
MTTPFNSREKVAIVGFAQSEVTRRASVPLGALTMDTVARAINDAGLNLAQIDGLSTGPLMPAFGEHSNVEGIDYVTCRYVAEYMGIRPRWFNNFSGIGQLSSSVVMAVNALAAGACDYVVLHRALHNPTGRYHGAPNMTRAAGSGQWTAPYGYGGPPVMMAMLYSEYMERYGATREDMATMIVHLRDSVRDYADAYWSGQVLTKEDYLDARMIADPISILDCDLPVEVAAAFVLTTADRARDLKNKPVYVAGFVQGQPDYRQGFRTLDDLMNDGKKVGAELWRHSGLGPNDIDVPQIYDGFSALTYLWLEALGYCQVGQAHQFIQGDAISLDGEFPLLSGGGSLGNGRLHGIAQMRECYLQLSQRAGRRQLPKAETAFACHGFPDMGGVIAYTAST